MKIMYETDANNIANIPVGDSPESIAVDEDDNIAYVANFQNTVSIISGTNQLV